MLNDILIVETSLANGASSSKLGFGFKFTSLTFSIFLMGLRAEEPLTSESEVKYVLQHACLLKTV